MAFLIAKFNSLASVQGINKNREHDHFACTDWICDKVLFLNDNYANVNFICLMATFVSLSGSCVYSDLEG